MTFPWLTVLGLLPIVGSLLPFLLKGRAGKTAGLVVALATLLLGISLMLVYKIGEGYQLTENLPWIPAFGARYALGLDGLGLTMVLLTVILVPIVLLAEWRVSDRAGRWGGHVFTGLVLLLEGLSIYVFTATDVLLFYLMFEATLLPMFFMISGFGGPRRSRAAIKFLLFSLAGGLVMLVSVIGLYVVSGRHGAPTYLLTDLAAMNIGGWTGRWLMLGFLIAFIIKAPMVPLHTWLPDTAEQATPGTSTLLVGVLDKIGTFGMLRYCLGLFPEASRWATPAVIVLALISVIYGGLVALGQKNLLRLVAFTSVSHFGLIVMGIFAMTTPSITGSMFYMLNHGFSTAALFLIVGMLIQRRGSAQLSAFGGVQGVAPILASLFLVAGLSSLALPGMSPFVSEFLVLAGTWTRWPWAAGIATIGMVLAALYILVTYQRTMTGPVTDQVSSSFRGRDMSTVERLVVAPLILLLLVFGFFPRPVLNALEPTSTVTMKHVGLSDVDPAAGKVEK